MTRRIFTSRHTPSTTSSLSFRVSASALVELLSCSPPGDVKARLCEALVSRAGLPKRDGFGDYDIVILSPSDRGLQEKEIPYEQFVKKVFMIRDNLRVLEQKINGEDGLNTAVKLSLQQQLTSAQAALLSFVGGPVNLGGDELMTDLVRDVEWASLILPAPALGEKWRDGTVAYANEDGQIVEPMAHFYHRLILMRDRLVTLEAMLDAQDTVSEPVRTAWRAYVRRSYGSLTTFNVLFKERTDYFSSK